MNPFSRDIVKNPRETPVTVASLNRDVLEALEAAFVPLTAGEKPRSATPGPKARLVLSPAPGYGKSHLIARLCASLADRATVVAFTPFQTAGLCWQSLLLQVLKTLQSPASPTGGPFSLTQLEVLARDVIRHLLAQALKSGRLDHPEPDKARRWALDQLTLSPQEEGGDWNEALHGLFLNQASVWRGSLADTGVDLADGDWPAVLFRYATSPAFSDQRQSCVAWMRGQALSAEARSSLGLAESSSPAPESSGTGELNDRCRERFHDLCRLAAFHRPFVFCFDQTEVFAQNETLALTFGRVIAELVNEAPHQLTVVTANGNVWNTKILPAMETADQHRLRKEGELKGLHRAEGEELIGLLTHHNGGDAAEDAAAGQAEALARVTDPQWLGSLFPTPGTNIPAREFLHQCQQRWEGLDTPAAAAAGSTEGNPPDKPDPAVTAARYQELLATALAAAARPDSTELHYLPDLFRWLTGTLLARPGECGTADHPDSFSELQWTLPGAAVIRFGFAHAASESYAVWKQLADYAAHRHRRDGTPVSKLVHFRTPDIQRCPIPRDSWKTTGPVILAALGQCLQVIDLTAEETAAIHAARQLYLEAESGDLEGVKGQDTLPFLAEKLAAWRDRLLAPPQAPSPSGAAGVPSDFKSAPGAAKTAAAASPNPKTAATAAVAGVSVSATATAAVTAGAVIASAASGTAGSGARASAAALTAAAAGASHPAPAPAKAAATRSLTPRPRPGLPVSGPGASPVGAFPAQPAGPALTVPPKSGPSSAPAKTSTSEESSPRPSPEAAITSAAAASPAPGTGTVPLVPAAGSPAPVPIPATSLPDPVITIITNPAFAAPPAAAVAVAVASPGAWRPGPEPDLSHAITAAYASFRIPVEVLARLEAPQLIRYHLRPGTGVTFSKISGHSVNLKIQLGLHIEPLIGSGPGHVIFDVVKEKPDTILWRDAMPRPEIADHPSPLALPVGVNIRNELIIADLCDSNTAHALIGGSSGSGKSELLKSLVATLVRRNTPRTLQLSLIDPKLLTFGGIPENPFLSGPVLRDTAESLTCLREAVEDMERRYEILLSGNFTRLGERIAAGLTDIPFRVLVFDEFADLINSGKEERKEFEQLIKSLSSKGRAAGVHLIIATQRPDREIVTGQLKANLPLKICLRVTNAVNSQILLDEPGAELLLGRGDLLCQSGSLPERGQSLFVPQAEFLGLFR
ncbi:MAG: FtsK/SpoIIIE domain-containing protein [Verrucomicrobiota bacterium]